MVKVLAPRFTVPAPAADEISAAIAWLLFEFGVALFAPVPLMQKLVPAARLTVETPNPPALPPDMPRTLSPFVSSPYWVIFQVPENVVEAVPPLFPTCKKAPVA
jgi:hypothetical protein